jgi:prephenate dehydrogenase
MRASFERVAVLGLGLLGGSVALAAKQRGVAARVVGATRRTDVLEQALRRGAVDEVGDFEAAARGADLVVLATPVFAMGELTRRIAPVLREGAIVSDVGSVKAGLAETLPGLLPRGVHYVGAHPMAGSHQRGMQHARADLFQGAACVVMESSDPVARERVAEFWRALGARVVFRDPALHDAEVAWMSHVPHLLAFAFAAALEEAPPGSLEVQGAGFRDFTRIAHSDSELWADILTANRKAIAAPLHAVERALATLARALEADDAEAVERMIAAARAALPTGGVRGSDSADERPEPPTAERPHGAGE